MMKKVILYFLVFLIPIMSFAQSPTNSVMTFDGNGDYAEFANTAAITHSTISAHTISLWFKANDVSNQQMLFELGGSWNGLNIYISNNNLYAGVWAQGQENQTNDNNFNGKWIGKPIEDNKWYHAALVYEYSGGTTATLILVLNGVSYSETIDLSAEDYDGSISLGDNGGFGAIISDTQAPDDGVADDKDDGDLDVDIDSPPNYLFFSGSMDNIGVVNGAVSVDNLIDHYYDPHGRTATSNLFAYGPYAAFTMQLPLYTPGPTLDNDVDNTDMADDSSEPPDYNTHPDYDALIHGDPTFEEDNSLPIVLSSFDAEVNNGVIDLTWTTESELNNAGFNLYRAENADSDYEKINGVLIEGAVNSSTPNTYTFTDTEVKSNTKYFYKLEDVSTSGETHLHGPVTVAISMKETAASKFILGAAYPNPFNPSTSINFMVAEQAQVKIDIYDMRGNLVNTLTDRDYSAGQYQVTWNAVDFSNNPVSAGIYIYHMATNTGFSQSAKMILIK